MNRQRAVARFDTPLALDNGAAILGAIPGPDADNVAIVGSRPLGAALASTIDHLKGLTGGGAKRSSNLSSTFL